MTTLREYAERRELLHNLVLRELRSRYKKSVLGWTWSLLNPLASVVVYTVVFGVFLKVKPPVGDPSGLHSFVLFLLCALIPWNYFSNSLVSSIDSLVSNAGLIKKVYFPREILVASTVGGLLVTMLIEMGVLVVILLFAGNMVLPWLPVAAVLIVLETMMCVGIGLVLSATNVYFRDVKHLTNILMQVLFYSAPIVYPISLVPDQWEIGSWSIPIGAIYRLNPLVQLFQAFRDVLYDLRFPPLATMAYLVAWAVGLVAVGLWWFSRLDHRLAEEV